MHIFLVSAAWLFFLLYFLSSVIEKYFKREVLTAFKSSKTSEEPFVTIIVPARNEEENIEGCIRSLLKQSYPTEKYKIVVVDDDSSDNTASIVRGIMTNHPNLTLVQADQLPDGWTGKNYACWTGVKHAEGEWYCFIDADVMSEPLLLVTVIDFASSQQIDLLSINPFQELVSVSERCLLPGIFIAVATSMNFKNVNDPSKVEAEANGQFMLFRRTVYESIGGHEAVRDVVMEDIKFARIVKESGNRLRWVFSDELIRTHMYRTFSQIWEGFSRNLAEMIQMRNAAFSIYITLRSLLLSALPLILPLWSWLHLTQAEKNILSYWGFGLSICGSTILLILALFTLNALRVPLRYFFFFPFGFLTHAVMTVNSLWKRKRGGRKWKGRIETMPQRLISWSQNFLDPHFHTRQSDGSPHD